MRSVRVKTENRTEIEKAEATFFKTKRFSVLQQKKTIFLYSKNRQPVYN